MIQSKTRFVKTISACMLVFAFMLVCTLALVGCASNAASGKVVTSDGTQSTQTATPNITVTANSEVKVVPDKAQIGVAVTTQAATAQDTQERNAADVNAVTEALAALGIAETSIQTTDTWLRPRYDYNNPIVYDEIAEDMDGATANTATNIVGYEMTTRLSISDLDIEQVGAVLEACVAAGATNSDGIQYYSSAYDEKYAEALAAAVEAAHTKAEVLANAAGVRLGGVASITEGYQNTAVRYDTGMLEAATAADSTMKVMPGEVDVTASVTVAYEIS